MTDIDELVQKFKNKLESAQRTEKIKEEFAIPATNNLFENGFATVFKELSQKICYSVGYDVVTFAAEGKSRFVLSGQFHRIYFQKGKIEVLDKVVSLSIIPIYIWKGVSKHLGPITAFVNIENSSINWDIPHETVEEYSKVLFSKLVEDIDFSM